MPQESYPPGRQPYDALVGLRVGGITGAILGGGLTALLGAAFVWLILAGAVLGAIGGYLWERRAAAHDRDDRT